MGRTSAAAISLLLVLFLPAACVTTSERFKDEVARPVPEDRRRPNARLFRDVARAMGAGARTPSWGSLLVDYDLDGFPDIFLNRHKRFPILLHNEAGRMFTGVDEPALEEPTPGRRIFDRHGCAWGEANGDGRPDLYCTAGAQDGTTSGANQLLLQSEDGLEDVATEWGAADPRGRGRSAHWLDHDSDGDLDIFVANEIRPGSPNVLFENRGGSFAAAPVGLETETPTRSSSWSDWDNDGDPDIVVLGHGFVGSRAYENVDGSYREITLPFLTAKSWLSASWGDFDSDGWDDVALVSERRLLILRNRRGSFVQASSGRVQAGRMVAWLDVENDGDLDAFLLQGRPGDPPDLQARDHSDLLLLNEAGRFRPSRPRPPQGPSNGNGDSVATGDFNEDGGVDLHITESYLEVHAPDRLLRNTADRGNWLRVMLKGPRDNPFAIGARIVVRTGFREYHDLMTDGVTFKSQSEIGYSHFGLGRGRATEVEVAWPDGSRSCRPIEEGILAISVWFGRDPC